jgi:hypothetical protein
MPKFQDTDIDKYFLLKSEDTEPCMMCKEPTHYIDVACESRFCSSECHDDFYRKYDEWVSNLDEEEL